MHGVILGAALLWANAKILNRNRAPTPAPARSLTDENDHDHDHEHEQEHDYEKPVVIRTALATFPARER
jgi:Zn-finger nucleic acid-binding protein